MTALKSKVTNYGDPFTKPIVSDIPIGYDARANCLFYCEEHWTVNSGDVVIWRRKKDGSWFSQINIEENYG